MEDHKLNWAQRLSLVQRNLRDAQTHLDSASEFLELLVQGVPGLLSEERKAPAPPLPADPPVRAPKTARPKKKGDRKPAGVFRDWVMAYAKRHHGVVVVGELKKGYEQEYGKRPSGGKLYEQLNDPALFVKRGEGRFMLAVHSNGARRSPAKRRPAPGLSEDIMEYALQNGGELLVRNYNQRFDEKFGDAASRTGTIYGALAQMIKSDRMVKVGKGHFRVLVKQEAPAQVDTADYSVE